MEVILEVWFSNSFYRFPTSALCMKLYAGKYHKTLLKTELNFGSDNGLVSTGNKHYMKQCWPISRGVTRPQRVNTLWHNDIIWRQLTGSMLVQVTACRLFDTKPLHELRLAYFQLDSVTRVKWWPPCQRTDMTLMEVSQRALDSLCIRNIWLLYIGVFFVNLIWYLYLFWLNKHCLSLKCESQCQHFQWRKCIQICCMKISILFSPECVKPKNVFTVCITTCFKNYIYILFQFVSSSIFIL